MIFNGLDAVLEAFRHNPSFALRGVSVASELAFGHLRYRLTDVPPQSNSPPDCVLRPPGVSFPALNDMLKFSA